MIVIFDVYILLRHKELAGIELSGLERVCLEELNYLINCNKYEIALISSSGYEQPDFSSYWENLLHNLPQLQNCIVLKGQPKNFLQSLLILPLKLVCKIILKFNFELLNFLQHTLINLYLYLSSEKIVVPANWHKRKIIYYSVIQHFHYGISNRLKIYKVATIHDIIPLRLATECSSYVKITFGAKNRQIMNQADAIFTVSQYTLDDLKNYYKKIPSITEVNWLGLSENFAKQTPVESNVLSIYGINSPYFLIVAAAGKRKNIGVAIKCFKKFITQEPNNKVNLVVVGNIGKEYQQEHILDKNIIFTGYVQDEELPLIYQNALGYLFLSQGEGFGLPLLEAMSAQTPIIASHAMCLPEIAGDAALYVNPQNDNEIVNAMQMITYDNALRNQLIEAGSRRLKLFSWERHNQRMINIFDCLTKEEI